MKRILYKIGIGLAILGFIGLGAGWYALETILPYMPIKPRRTNVASQGWQLPRGVDPAAYGLDAKRFDFVSKDGQSMKAMFIRSSDTAHTTLIMVHGIGGCKEHYLPAATQLVASGLNVVLFDLRAQGESGGDYNTFDFLEKNDILILVDTLARRYPQQRFGIFGNSLGGAIALQALSVEPRLQFGIIESTFHDLQTVIAEYGEDIFGVKSPWLAVQTLTRSAAIAHFPALEIKPYLAARKIHQPVFMAHGDQDDKIPLAFGRENFDNLASSRKQWYTVKGAHHLGVWQSGGAAYYQAMMAFVHGG
ncbi:MAG: alpha/beta fold hydrolase [Lewinellaceae bacterium]|nr:alpha/beta fold hydrolase [Lewinellaceae bacterium]